MSPRSVAVIGGGASGALQAISLRRAGVEQVTMIERRLVPGRGVAYGTVRQEHLLNVNARRMSAYADQPDHFERWYEARGGGPEDFAPRRLFGDYLVEQLEDAGAGIEVVRAEAVDVAHAHGRERIRLDDGGIIEADAAILALGNLNPATPRGIDAHKLGALYVDDPWFGGLAEGLGEQDTIFLIGTGLTAVDVAVTLDATGFKGRILALSRRGLAPRAHAPREPMTAPGDELPAQCIALLRRVRRRSAEVGWRSAVHELRPVTQGLWSSASPRERSRFLRHLRPWWDVHRHRIAPEIAARIDTMQRQGRLEFGAGKIVAVEPGEREALIRYRPRGSDTTRQVATPRIVNCTGPETDIRRAPDRLLDALLASGRIRPDPSRIGIHVDEESRVIGSDGRPWGTLSAIGPMTRGAFWEIVAIPDIVNQVRDVARRHAAAAA